MALSVPKISGVSENLGSKSSVPPVDCHEYSGRSYPSYQTLPNSVFSVVSGCGLEIDQLARRPSAVSSYRLLPETREPGGDGRRAASGEAQQRLLRGVVAQPDVAFRVGGHEALVPRRDADRRDGRGHRVEHVDLAEQPQARVLRGPHAEPRGDAALLVAEDDRLAAEKEGDRGHGARILRLDRHELGGRDRPLGVDAHREKGSRGRRGHGFLARLGDRDPGDPRPAEPRREVLDGGRRGLRSRQGVLLFLRQLHRHEVRAARRGENQVPPILPGGGDLSHRASPGERPAPGRSGVRRTSRSVPRRRTRREGAPRGPPRVHPRSRARGSRGWRFGRRP